MSDYETRELEKRVLKGDSEALGKLRLAYCREGPLPGVKAPQGPWQFRGATYVFDRRVDFIIAPRSGKSAMGNRYPKGEPILRLSAGTDGYSSGVGGRWTLTAKEVREFLSSDPVNPSDPSAKSDTALARVLGLRPDDQVTR